MKSALIFLFIYFGICIGVVGVGVAFGLLADLFKEIVRDTEPYNYIKGRMWRR